MTTVGIAIPAIPPRIGMLNRALLSAISQTRTPDALSVAVDHDHQGAAATRNRAWRALDTDWVAFLDDDDELLPEHLAVLLDAAETTGADIVYPWHQIMFRPGQTPFEVLFINGQPAENHPFDDEARDYMLTTGNFVPVTALVRRDALEKIGGFPEPRSERWAHEECEDWGCWQDMLRAGFTFHHVPQRTWLWHWHANNTSGRNDRW